jgi:uncharacterized protein (TIGR03089 family)
VVSLAGSARPPSDAPQDVPALLRRLLDDDPGRPRLTWYGPDGERVELSAKVLDNWVAKTANLLVDELDAGPGSRVAILLPPHWRTVCWLLATWSVGACAVVGGSDQPVDVLVSSNPGQLRDPGPMFGPDTRRAVKVAVALPALATGFGPDLPLGAVDAAGEVRAQGDVFVPFVRPVAGDPALDVAGQASITHGRLLADSRRTADDAGLPARVRLLSGAGPDRAVAELLAPLVRLGSVVLHHDLDDLDPQALQHLRTQEAVTFPPSTQTPPPPPR